jgi:hypothetical protein
MNLEFLYCLFFLRFFLALVVMNLFVVTSICRALRNHNEAMCGKSFGHNE